MYYPCSENQGADQLHGHREADLLVFTYAKRRFSHNKAQVHVIRHLFQLVVNRGQSFKINDCIG